MPNVWTTCRKCHGSNHFAKMCRSRNINNRNTKSRIHEVKKEESTGDFSSDENELFIGEIMKTTGEDVLIANLKVKGKM